MQIETTDMPGLELMPLVTGLTVAEVFTDHGADPIIGKIREAIAKLDLDPSSVAGRDLIRSTAYKIAQAKTRIDDAGKSYVDDLKALPRVVDAERRRVRDELDALRDEVRAPLTAFENKEKERVAHLEAAIAQIDAYMTFLPEDTEEIEARIGIVRGLFLDFDFQEFAARAVKAREQAVARLTAAASDARQAAAERAELARLQALEAERARAESVLRQAQRERQEALDRERWAQAEREASERRAEDAARRAESDRSRAAAQAERERIAAVAAERRRAEIARQAQLDMEAKRTESVRIRNRAHREILTAIMAEMVPLAGAPGHETLTVQDVEALARLVGLAIANGKIPRVEVKY